MTHRTKQSKSFLELQAEWDQRLADDGFKDIEDRRTGLLDNSVITDNFDRALYYELAHRLLSEVKFPSREDRSIWELHSEGTPQRDIAEKLGITRAKVRRRIHKYKTRMGKGY